MRRSKASRISRLEELNKNLMERLEKLERLVLTNDQDRFDNFIKNYLNNHKSGNGAS